MAFIQTPDVILAKERRTGCISLFPVPMVQGVLSEVPMTPSKVCPLGREDLCKTSVYLSGPRRCSYSHGIATQIDRS